MDSLGSSATKQTQAAQNFTNAQDAAIARAMELYKRGPTPNVGIDVVAINDAEKAALQNVNAAANAFGLQGASTMPFEGMEVIEQGGLRGYSSYPVFLDNMKRLKELRPAQYAEMSKLAGYDMITGEPIAPPPAPVAAGSSYSSNNDDDGPSHAEIMAMHYGINSGNPSSKLDTKGQIGKYSKPSHGLSFGQQLKADLGYAAATAKKDIGKLFGGFGGGGK